jgi:hypothetical protein
MQKQASQSLQSRLDEIGPVFEPGTTLFTDDAARGIIKIVSAEGSPNRKTYHVSLLTWEMKRREKSTGPRP